MTAVHNIFYGISFINGRLNISVGNKPVMCQQKKGEGKVGEGGGGGGYLTHNVLLHLTFLLQMHSPVSAEQGACADPEGGQGVWTP